ncbi:hypothetical protein [Caudoviricetes sp.]|nr:hypothetical protein [Caudoviricetes sp.]
MQIQQTIQVLDVFSIHERCGDEKVEWLKIGVAFTNKDGSLNVVMDNIPLSGKIHIRPRQKKGEAK